MRLLARAAASLAALLLADAPALAQGREDRAGDFDFYVLALSWSPSYCEAEGSEADPRQCGATRPLGFIVHGLWPQYERGSPERCDPSSREVSREIVRSVGDLIPSPGLVRHQWRKHGTCSGLSQAEYFALLREAREAVTIPPPFRNPQAPRSLEPRQAEQLFTRANPGLTADAIAVTCDGGLLREVRICLDKALRFRACPEVDRRSCRQRAVRLPPTGG